MLLTEKLRAGVEASPLSNAEIARQAGMSESQVSRFARGETGLNVETAWRLADAIGWRLSLRKGK